MKVHLIKYRFSPNVSCLKKVTIKFFDYVIPFLRKDRKKKFLTENFEEITIVQLAHIGDVVLTLPAIKALKIISNKRIKLVISSQCLLLVKELSFIDSIVLVDAPYFSRNSEKSYFKFIKQLRGINAEVLFDVRGDFRNILFIKLFTKTKFLIGFEVGGGGALLDKVLDYPFEKHISNVFNPLFSFLKIETGNLSLYWNEDILPWQSVPNVDIRSKYIVIHIGTGASARKWPIEKFKELIEVLAKDNLVYLLGSNNDISDVERDDIYKLPNVQYMVGKTSLLESIFIVKNSSYFIGLESGFTHIASLLGRTVFAIYSGTTDEVVWSPYSIHSNQVYLIKKSPPCSLLNGCGKLICGNNICMQNIKVDEILGLIRQYNSSQI